jgi:hypothetical protein
METILVSNERPTVKLDQNLSKFSYIENEERSFLNKINFELKKNYLFLCFLNRILPNT